MNLILINATLFIDLGKCLAAPIHLLKGNLIRAHIIPHLLWALDMSPSFVAPFP